MTFRIANKAAVKAGQRSNDMKIPPASYRERVIHFIADGNVGCLVERAPDADRQALPQTYFTLRGPVTALAGGRSSSRIDIWNEYETSPSSSSRCRTPMNSSAIRTSIVAPFFIGGSTKILALSKVRRR